MATKKRPPLVWDSRDKVKPLPYSWGLYVKSDLIRNIVAYDVPNRFYLWFDGLSNNTVRNVSFIVKRLG